MPKDQYNPQPDSQVSPMERIEGSMEDTIRQILAQQNTQTAHDAEREKFLTWITKEWVREYYPK